MTLLPGGQRRPTQPIVERPETPQRVRDKLAEGELLYARLSGQVGIMGERLDALTESQRQTRGDVAEIRGDLRELEKRSERRDAATRAEIKAVSSEVVGLRKDLDARLDGIEKLITFHRGVEAGQGGATEVTAPLPSPLTSTGQARRAAVVGGGGLSLATVLGVVASIGQLPAPLQWGLVGLAILAGLGALAIAVRWGWRAAGR